MSKVKIGFIGIGDIIGCHLDALKANPEYELMGVCRRSPDKLRAQAATLGVKGYSDYRDMIIDKPDVVLISLPHNLHYQVALDALDAGCHVLMEKPVAISMKEINGLVTASKKAGRIILPAESSYWQSSYCTARKIVRSGKLGELLLGNFINHRFYFTDSRPDWFFKSEISGGGQFMNIGVHRAAAVRCIIGDDYEEESVTAAIHKTNPKYDIEAATQAHVMYKGGEGMIYEECGLFKPPSELSSGLHFVFKKGILGIAADHVWISDIDGHVIRCKFLPEAEGGAYGALYGEMLKAINGERYYPEFRHGAKDARIALAAYASAKQKTIIQLDNADWRIL